jgi:hypothetical protein
MVKQARASGQLNLSNRGLVMVPDRVWTVGELDKEEQRKVSQVSMDSQPEENWWEQVDMTKLILACNKISEISPKVCLQLNMILFLVFHFLDLQPGESASAGPAR